MRFIEEEKDEELKGFDKRVTFRDPRTGRIVRKNPYIKRVCAKSGGGSVRYFERPAGSGNLFDAQGNAVGRWDITKPEGERFLAGAAHLAWEKPLTEDEKLEQTLRAKENENAILKAELAAMKAEATKKASDKGKSKES